MLLALLGVEIAFGRLIPGVRRDDRGKSIKPPQQTPIEILQEMQNIRSAFELPLAREQENNVISEPKVA